MWKQYLHFEGFWFEDFGVNPKKRHIQMFQCFEHEKLVTCRQGTNVMARTLVVTNNVQGSVCGLVVTGIDWVWVNNMGWLRMSNRNMVGISNKRSTGIDGRGSTSLI
jgi:hypothetical protein